MQLSSAAASILKAREALRLTAYLDQAKVWTIGYGCTYYESGAKVKPGDKITTARAEQLFAYHAGVAAAGVNKYVTATLNQGQFDALHSFTYNIGVPKFAGSSLLKTVNANPNNVDAIAAKFREWRNVTIDGKLVISNGLVARREEEIEMYKSGAGIVAVKKNGSLIFIAIALLLLLMNRYAKRH